MSFLNDFKSFAIRGNVVDLAVAVIVGGAFGKIVSSLVADLLMPVVGAALPSGDWRAFELSPIDGMNLRVGNFAGTVVDFVIVSFAIFVVVQRLMRGKPKDVDSKTCGECLESIPKAARRCRACTSVQP